MPVSMNKTPSSHTEKMRGNSAFRQILLRRASNARFTSSSSCINGTHFTKSRLPNSPINWKLFSTNSFVKSQSLSPLIFQRTISSSSGSPNVLLIKTDKEFDSTLKTIQENSSSALFYYTAVWCGPCKFISPVLEELSKKYAHVTTYKLDIDEEALQATLSKQFISAVPTLHFFHEGKKVDEIVGADPVRLKTTMEELYG